MKTLKKNISAISILFTILILLQSCVAYKQGTYTLEEAANMESMVKVHTITNETMKFKRIGVENDQYYGVKKEKGELVRVPLDRTMLNEIKVKDKTMSTILTITLPIVIIAASAIIFQDAFKWKDSNEPLFPPGFF